MEGRSGRASRIAAYRRRPASARRTARPAGRQPGPDGSTTEPATRPLMLSVEQVCATLGVGRTTLWAMVRDGEIGSVKRGTRLQFPLAVVEEYVAQQAERAREHARRRQRLAARATRR